MYVNEEDNLKAEQLFTKAIHEGHSKNAMLNLAMCYWGVECNYQKAVDLLKYVSTLNEPSIHCLWNLAYLQYMGDKCQNNPLKRDLNECANTLKRIIALADNPSYAEDKKVINNAIAALYLTATPTDVCSSMSTETSSSAITLFPLSLRVLCEARRSKARKLFMIYALHAEPLKR
jgi:TPR repeat protein